MIIIFKRVDEETFTMELVMDDATKKELDDLHTNFESVMEHLHMKGSLNSAICSESFGDIKIVGYQVGFKPKKKSSRLNPNKIQTKDILKFLVKFENAEKVKSLNTITAKGIAYTTTHHTMYFFSIESDEKSNEVSSRL